MTLLTDVSALARAVRRRLTTWRYVRAVNATVAGRGEVADGGFEVLVFFPDPQVNLYQITQWYEPLRLLHERHRVVVVARSARAAQRLLAECPVPVHYLVKVADLEEFVAAQPMRVFAYVNQNSRNFTAMRFTRPAHVFLNHGESDKAFMASNQVKAYDAVFVAGPAAVRRIETNVYDAHRANLVVVGRPQVDVHHEGPTLPADGRTVVLYAPTWEGDRLSNAYSSVASHGEEIVRSLLATGRHRLVYRPHPRTGAQSKPHGEANQRIRSLVAAANRADPEAGHLVDELGRFGWHVDAADVCIADISAVCYDWLATSKPLLLTRPVAPEAVVDPGGIARAVPLLDAIEADRAADRVDAMLAAGPDVDYLELVADHFGDTTPGASMARFLDAMHSVITERAAAQDTRAGQIEAEQA